MILYLTPSAVSVIFIIVLNILTTFKINNNAQKFLDEINKSFVIHLLNTSINPINNLYKVCFVKRQMKKKVVVINT